jgi:hypothetical protein
VFVTPVEPQMVTPSGLLVDPALFMSDRVKVMWDGVDVTGADLKKLAAGLITLKEAEEAKYELGSRELRRTYEPHYRVGVVTGRGSLVRDDECAVGDALLFVYGAMDNVYRVSEAEVCVHIDNALINLGQDFTYQLEESDSALPVAEVQHV